MAMSYEIGEGFLGEHLKGILLATAEGMGWWGESVLLKSSVVANTCKPGQVAREAITEAGSRIAKAMIGSQNQRGRWKPGGYNDHNEWQGLYGSQGNLTHRQLWR